MAGKKSFATLGLVRIMRNKHLAIFGFCLVALVVAFPEKIGMPLDVNREIERIEKSVNEIDTENVVSRYDPLAYSKNPEKEMATVDIIRSQGYKAEEHFVKSDDGYILALHRIPGPKDLTPWHEMGVYDIPAEIDYISSINDKGLLYIGHSMGATMFFVMASERPEYGAKVKAMFGLAPVAFTNHIQRPSQALGNTLRYLEVNADHRGMYEVFNQNPYSRFAAKCICNQPILRNICGGVIQAVVGFNSKQSNLIDMIRRWGYKAEEHFVTSEDGYILALHRIPGPKGSTPVLMHHALMESSFCWVITGKGKGLAFLLADAGYDVWMANARGNTYSRNHTTKSPNDPDFWDFSWHEMGVYDIPVEIDYISSNNDEGLLYIGHSMGTTMFFVMASERPEYGAKVKAMLGLAPVAFTNHIRGPFHILGNILRFLQINANHQGKYEFFSQNHYFKFAAKCICNRPLLRNICDAIVQSVVGFNSQQSNTTMLPLILTHTPAGTSMKTIIHFAQGIQTGKFRHYDHGEKTNNLWYNDPQPPEYDFSKIQVPIALFWGQNDFLAQPKDVSRLYERLPKKVEMYQIDDPNFNHLDFLWAVDAPKLVYSRLMALMDEYRSADDV